MLTNNVFLYYGGIIGAGTAIVIMILYTIIYQIIKSKLVLKINKEYGEKSAID